MNASTDGGIAACGGASRPARYAPMPTSPRPWPSLVTVRTEAYGSASTIGTTAETVSARPIHGWSTIATAIRLSVATAIRTTDDSPKRAAERTSTPSHTA